MGLIWPRFLTVEARLSPVSVADFPASLNGASIKVSRSIESDKRHKLGYLVT